MIYCHNLGANKQTSLVPCADWKKMQWNDGEHGNIGQNKERRK